MMKYERIFFPLSLNLDGRLCVVIGDDCEAVEKEAALRESGADVRRIKDVGSLQDSDVSDAFFVISTPQDEALSARLRKLADEHRFLLCCIDQPKYGFVAMAAIAKAGPVRIAISTAGLAPRVGKILKEALQRAMDATFEKFIARQAEIRRQTREEFPDSPAKRRAAMIDAAEGFKAQVRFEYPPSVTPRPQDRGAE